MIFILSKDRQGMPIIAWAAECKSREAMSAILNAGAPATTVHRGSRLRRVVIAFQSCSSNNFATVCFIFAAHPLMTMVCAYSLAAIAGAQFYCEIFVVNNCATSALSTLSTPCLPPSLLPSISQSKSCRCVCLILLQSI